MDEIPQFFRNMLSTFDGLRGKDVKASSVPFWDIVVLTASDELQREAYQLQIEDKLSHGQLPTGIPYLVYADPPAPRAGCGASTMNVICELVKLYGWVKLNTWKVLLLNAGGQSQRLPSASVLGKIFTTLPIGGSNYQMLELKLALYLPFVKRMCPGVFHPASDCVELYALHEEDEWSFSEPGITALAHPSSLSIGRTHGVYVLEGKKAEKDNHNWTEFRTCLKVLQKPSISKMREEGAVLVDNEENEFVYTDSLFFFDHSVSKLLAEFFIKESPLNCEIDSYGDFLQALGARATIDYTLNTANVSAVESNLINVRQKLFHLLHGVPLHVVALNASKFYHYGTFAEYLHHFTEDELIANEMNFTRSVSSTIFGENGISRENGIDKPPEKKMKLERSGLLLHSAISKGSCLPENCIVEYCHFTVPIILGSNVVLSNCEFLGPDPSPVKIPENTFLHTVSVLSDGKVQYCTILFSVNDNLKTRSSLKGLKLYGLSLDEALERLGYRATEVFAETSENAKWSLWEAKLFPALPSLPESFKAAVNMISALNVPPKSQVKKAGPAGELFSMVDIMRKKNISVMLEFRNKITKIVNENSNTTTS